MAVAIDFGLKAGVVRGVAPADLPLTSARSRRSRRVTHAATSTRVPPLKLHPGDTAAACNWFFSLSGEDEALVQVAADLVLCRRSQGLVCYFLVCGGPFCIFGSAVQILDCSCTSSFLT